VTREGWTPSGGSGRGSRITRQPISDASDVGGEEVDAVAVEVAAGAVVVLGVAGVGVPGEDLRATQRQAGVPGVR
jgi:hypothetical protein